MQAIYDRISQFFDAIIGSFQWVLDLIQKLIITLWDFAKDVFAFVLDEILKLVVSIMETLDFSGLLGYASNFDLLPDDLINVLGLCGLGTCMGIIAAAITIKITLQLIPFTRLGS